ncbi:biotin/lipoyl-binding protein [candidate division KSB1 bacterium]|nr:biotin/lipoyl-binding protein [candidate division KSB1 bacterium]
MSNAVKVTVGEREYEVEIRNGETTVNGQRVQLSEAALDSRGGLKFELLGRRMSAVIDRGKNESFVRFRGREFALSVVTERERLLRSLSKSAEAAGGRAEIKASMPGLVIRVLGSIGQPVKKGEPVLILEAMKMENEIRAPGDGVISQIKVAQGQAVEKGDLLLVLE